MILAWNWPGTCKLLRIHDAITLILIRRLPTRLLRHGHILDLNPRTRTRRAALQLRDRFIRSRIQRSPRIPERNIPDVKRTRVTIPRRAIISSALSDHKRNASVIRLKVGEGDVRSVACTATAAVWGIAFLNARPGLDIGDVRGLVGLDIACSDVFDGLETTGILTDATNRNTGSSAAGDVFHKDIGGVRLLGNTVVTVGNVPVPERNIVCINGIRAVGVLRGSRAIGCVVHINIAQEDILGMNYSHSPHLALYKAYVLDYGVVYSGEGDLMGTTWIVRGAIYKVIPDLPVAV